MQYDKQAMPLYLPVKVDLSAAAGNVFTYTAEKDFNIRDISFFLTEATGATVGHSASVDIGGVEKAVFTPATNKAVGTVLTPDTAIKTGIPIAVTAGTAIAVNVKTTAAQPGEGYIYLWIQEEA